MDHPLDQLPTMPNNRRPAPLQMPYPADVLSPPITPVACHDLTAQAARNLEVESRPSQRRNSTSARAATTSDLPAYLSIPSWESTTPSLYSGYYTLQEELGRGVWSTVYRAEETNLPKPPSSSLDPGALTPPTSPSRRALTGSESRIIAVKAPLNRAAHAVLAHEARILTYLHSNPVAASHIVPFHGYDRTAHALVMASLPLTLEKHIKNALSSSCENFTTRTMYDPILDLSWTTIATSLINGLAYLHSRNCIHGDIKPANILLCLCPHPHSTAPNYIPIYCDFSSSIILSPSSTSSTPSMTLLPAYNDAITATFSAPELLTASAGPNTFASDVYSLAVTLLVAATGESPYASAKSDMQRLTMAKEGRPLDFARGGDQGTRLSNDKMIVRWLEKAVERWPEKRWATAGEWKDGLTDNGRSL